MNRFIRKIPINAQIKILFSSAISQIGWFFFGFGMIFFWVFAANADFEFIDYMFREPVYAEGKLIETTGTGASEDEVTVYMHTFVFKDARGRVHKGYSYSTGSIDEDNAMVEVKYPKGKPGLSRINGMRRKMFGPFVIFVVIFPVVGIVFIILSLRKGLSAIRLLRTGVTSEGRLVLKSATNTEVNEKTVYKMKFKFKSNDGKDYTVSAKTHLPEVLQDDRMEKLFYNPKNPSDAVLFDSIPGNPEIDSTGGVKNIPFKRIFLSIIIPSITILGHLIYLFLF